MKKILFVATFIITLFSCRSQEQTRIARFEQKLIESLEEDQKYRISLDSLFKTDSIDNEKIYLTIVAMNKADSLNQLSVLPIIDTIASYGIYNLSKEAYKSCWLIIQHSDAVTMEKYLPFIKELHNRDLIESSNYETFLDRHLVYNRKAQEYGTQLYRFPDGRIIRYPVRKSFSDSSNRNKETHTDYCDILLNESQYAIIGAIYYSPDEMPKGVKGAEIYSNGFARAISDENGFFQLIMSKVDAPDRIIVKKGTKQFGIDLNRNDEDDFSIILHYLNK